MAELVALPVLLVALRAIRQAAAAEAAVDTRYPFALWTVLVAEEAGAPEAKQLDPELTGALGACLAEVAGPEETAQAISLKTYPKAAGLEDFLVAQAQVEALALAA